MKHFTSGQTRAVLLKGGSHLRDHYQSEDIPFHYVNVRKNEVELARMLELSGGVRQVPVIVEDGKVTIGYGGT